MAESAQPISRYVLARDGPRIAFRSATRRCTRRAIRRSSPFTAPFTARARCTSPSSTWTRRCWPSLAAQAAHVAVVSWATVATAVPWHPALVACWLSCVALVLLFGEGRSRSLGALPGASTPPSPSHAENARAVLSTDRTFAMSCLPFNPPCCARCKLKAGSEPKEAKTHGATSLAERRQGGGSRARWPPAQ